MMKLKALIVDDEPKLRRVLQLKLEDNCPEITICGLAENIQEAYNLIQQYKPELLFLDIAMPGGSGFDLLDHFDLVPFEIIFVTGFNDFALDALRVSAVDYLLKPVNTQKLVDATKRAKKRLEDRNKIIEYDILKHNLNHLGEQASKIAIPGLQSHGFVSVADIIRCEGWQKYTRIYLQDGSQIISSYNIGTFRELLVPYNFHLVHKSHLINIQHIRDYNNRNGKLEMKDGALVPVARRKRENFVNEIMIDG